MCKQYNIKCMYIMCIIYAWSFFFVRLGTAEVSHPIARCCCLQNCMGRGGWLGRQGRQAGRVRWVCPVRWILPDRSVGPLPICAIAYRLF